MKILIVLALASCALASEHKLFDWNWPTQGANAMNTANFGGWGIQDSINSASPGSYFDFYFGMDFEVLYGTWYQGGQNLTDTFFTYGARTWAYYDIWWRMDFFQSYYIVDRWVISAWDIKPWVMTLSSDVAFAKGRNCFQMWWSMLGPNVMEQVRENMKVIQMSLYD